MDDVKALGISHRVKGVYLTKAYISHKKGSALHSHLNPMTVQLFWEMTGTLSGEREGRASFVHRWTLGSSSLEVSISLTHGTIHGPRGRDGHRLVLLTCPFDSKTFPWVFPSDQIQFIGLIPNDTNKLVECRGEAKARCFVVKERTGHHPVPVK